jgi:hypothetical protein
MDGKRFDGLLRTATTAHSRRGAVVAVLGGMVGLLGPTETEAKRKKHKKKKGGSPPPPKPRCPATCPDCQQCVNGQSCTPKADGTACGNNDCKTCQSGACVNKADNTLCNDSTGKCGSGTCKTPPACLPFGGQCGGPGASPLPCCGAGQTACVVTIPFPGGNISQCQGLGAPGAPCLVDPDCLSQQCAGFVCR